jgi:hypothetical protein
VTANLPVTAAAIFDEFSAATGQRIASGGVPPSAAVTHQEVVFFEGGKSDTGVAFANPSSGGVSISLQLLDTNGAALFPAANIQLAGNNHVARFVSELSPNSRHTQGTMQIQSSFAVAAMPLYFNGDRTFFTGPVVTLASLMNPLELFVQIAGSATRRLGSKRSVLHWS